MHKNPYTELRKKQQANYVYQSNVPDWLKQIMTEKKEKQMPASAFVVNPDRDSNEMLNANLFITRSDNTQVVKSGNTYADANRKKALAEREKMARIGEINAIAATPLVPPISAVKWNTAKYGFNSASNAYLSGRRENFVPQDFKDWVNSNAQKFNLDPVNRSSGTRRAYPWETPPHYSESANPIAKNWGMLDTRHHINEALLQPIRNSGYTPRKDDTVLPYDLRLLKDWKDLLLLAPSTGKTLLYNEQTSQEKTQNASITDFDKVLQYQTNRLYAVDKPAWGSYNAQTKKYYAFASAEGGAKTVGYGLKLYPDKEWTKLYNKQGYLTKEQHDKFMRERIKEDYEKTKQFYNKLNKMSNAFEKLSPEWQAFLIDYNYNPGITQFPKLVKAVFAGDIEAIKKECLRYLNGKPLGRNKIMLKDIYLIINNQYTGNYE